MSGVELMKPFSLTYVRYPGGDPLGVAMALASLAPFCVIVATFGAFFARRELWDVGTLLGILANEILAQTLKRVFQQPRPVSCTLVDFCRRAVMPSSHAQLAWFAAAVAILALAATRRAPASARVLDAFGALLVAAHARWRSRSPRAACTSGTTPRSAPRRRGGAGRARAALRGVGPRVARVRIGETRVMGGGRREGRGHARLVAGGEPGGGGEEAPCRADGRARGDAREKPAKHPRRMILLLR